MIKGHTLIDLKNIHTGEVEHWEDDNMVTNALTYFLAQGGMTNPTALNNYIRGDMIKYLLGGVMLLDTALTEQATNVRVPAGIGMTANGAMEILNSEAPTELGSWNASESGWQQDGSYKMVWDWTTSQGNGTINCVSLTSRYQGMRGIGNKSGGRKNNSIALGDYNATVGYTVEGKEVFGYNSNKLYAIQSMNNVTEFAVDVIPFPVTSQDVRDTIAPATRRVIETITLTIPEAMKSNTNDKMCVSYSANNHIYAFFTVRVPFGRSSVAYILDFNCSTKTGTWQTIDFTQLGLTDVNLNDCNVGISPTHIIADKYLVELANTSNNYELDMSITNAIFCFNGERFYNITGSGSFVVDAVTHSAYPTNGSAPSFYGPTANKLLGFSYNEGSGGTTRKVFRDIDYIATINNLDSAVTKTADKTMKVTYILRFS